MAAKTTNKLFDAIEEAQWDMLLACSAVGLALFGLVMVYSASGAITTDKVIKNAEIVAYAVRNVTYWKTLKAFSTG